MRRRCVPEKLVEAVSGAECSLAGVVSGVEEGVLPPLPWRSFQLNGGRDVGGVGACCACFKSRQRYAAARIERSA